LKQSFINLETLVNRISGYLKHYISRRALKEMRQEREEVFLKNGGFISRKESQRAQKALLF